MEKVSIVLISASDFKFNQQLNGIFPKGWVEIPDGCRALFKQAAQDLSDIPESRTDWPEKVVSELNKLVRLPAADYELAQVADSDNTLTIPGSLSLDLTLAEDRNRFPLSQMLQDSVFNYDYAFDYEVGNAIKALADNEVGLPPNYELPDKIEDGADLLVGILMIDALTSNTDRHDENLELVVQRNGYTYLSPVFDHGFSLGAVLDDSMRNNNSPQRYASEYSDSSFSRDGEDLTGIEAFREAAKLRPEAAISWLEELDKVNSHQIEELFARLPEEVITPTAKEFAIELLQHNKQQLLSLKQSISQTKTQQQRVKKIAPILLDYLQLNQNKKVETDDSVVEFNSQTKTVSYQSKINSEEFLAAQYIDGSWLDRGSNISSSKESYFVNEAAPKVNAQLKISSTKNQSSSQRQHRKRL